MERFPEVWVIDTEFIAQPGERPIPVCLVGKEIRTGKEVSLWLHDQPVTGYPFPPDCLIVAYFASAELGFFRAMDWPSPPYIFDLYAEFKNRTNGRPPVCGYGLLGACHAYGIKTEITPGEKDDSRSLIIRGPPYTAQERERILKYCRSDVQATTALFQRFVSYYQTPGELGRALIRGKYMDAVAGMEWQGVPIDTVLLDILREGWENLKTQLVQEVDRDFGVFEDTHFRKHLFASYLERDGIPWPVLPSGELRLDSDTFRDMAKTYPALQPLHELRYALGQLKLNDLAVGTDGRNRTLLSPFRSKTGRNQPSNAKFIFGPARWLRALITPEPGTALAYIDYRSAELGVAAALSKDRVMEEDYLSGDPYIQLAISAGAAPPGATKATHPDIRTTYKTVALGLQYGMSPEGLALRLSITVPHAREIVRAHRARYHTFWKWSDRNITQALGAGFIVSPYGWRMNVPDIGGKDNPERPRNPERTLMNWQMQAAGADMLRIACILADHEGVKLVAPVHDALLIEAEESEIENAATITRQCMEEASRLVLDGFRIDTDCIIIPYKSRYPETGEMWNTIKRMIGVGTTFETEEGIAQGSEVVLHG